MRFQNQQNNRFEWILKGFRRAFNEKQKKQAPTRFFMFFNQLPRITYGFRVGKFLVKSAIFVQNIPPDAPHFPAVPWAPPRASPASAHLLLSPLSQKPRGRPWRLKSPGTSPAGRSCEGSSLVKKWADDGWKSGIFNSYSSYFIINS